MDAAERAYEAAKQIVAEARATGGRFLNFNIFACRALTRLPDEVLDLPHVAVLNLRNTAITDAGVEQIARINGLKTLDLNNTAITDAGAEKIAQINGLERLYLSNTAITDAGAEQIARINGLKELYLDNTAITDAGAEQIARINGLEMLDLRDTAITDAGAEKIARINGLKMLDLDNTAITDAGVEQIARISGLERLWLNNTAITDAGAKQIARINGLKMLSLSNTQIRDLRKLRPLSMLTTGRGNLTFGGSLATQLDPGIARIAKLSQTDTPAALRDYLATLDEDEYSDFLARRAIEIGLDPPPPPPPKGEPQTPGPARFDRSADGRLDYHTPLSAPPQPRAARARQELQARLPGLLSRVGNVAPELHDDLKNYHAALCADPPDAFAIWMSAEPLRLRQSEGALSQSDDLHRELHMIVSLHNIFAAGTDEIAHLDRDRIDAGALSRAEANTQLTEALVRIIHEQAPLITERVRHDLSRIDTLRFSQDKQAQRAAVIEAGALENLIRATVEHAILDTLEARPGSSAAKRLVEGAQSGMIGEVSVAMAKAAVPYAAGSLPLLAMQLGPLLNGMLTTTGWSTDPTQMRVAMDYLRGWVRDALQKAEDDAPS